MYLNVCYSIWYQFQYMYAIFQQNVVFFGKHELLVDNVARLCIASTL